MDEAQAITEMRLAIEGAKKAGEPTEWASGSRDDYLRLTVPLICDKPMASTLWLTWRTALRTPDMDVSVTLMATLQGQDLRCWRIDWRPRSPHTNQLGPPNLRGLEVWTGVHDIRDNLDLPLAEALKRNLPVCGPVEPEPPTFNELTRFVCDTLSIEPHIQIDTPPWSPILL